MLQTDHEIKKVVHRSLSAKMIVKRMLFILVGALLMAVGLEFFLVPNEVIDGGIVGISIILSHLTDSTLR